MFYASKEVPVVGFLGTAVADAFGMLVGGDPQLTGIVLLSIRVSLFATILACSVAFPLGAALACGRFPGRQLAIVVVNGSMGLPPVVVGLVLYLLLSRSGPLGELGILFTPQAMIIAQAILVVPIVTALTQQTVADALHEFDEQLRSLGASRWRIAGTLLWNSRFSLVTAAMAGLGRSFAEVGAVLLVGGNIAGHTRVMTTTIALETSKGDLPLAMALGLVLIALVMTLNLAALVVNALARRRYG